MKWTSRHKVLNRHIWFSICRTHTHTHTHLPHRGREWERARNISPFSAFPFIFRLVSWQRRLKRNFYRSHIYFPLAQFNKTFSVCVCVPCHPNDIQHTLHQKRKTQTKRTDRPTVRPSVCLSVQPKHIHIVCTVRLRLLQCTLTRAHIVSELFAMRY